MIALCGYAERLTALQNDRQCIRVKLLRRGHRSSAARLDPPTRGDEAGAKTSKAARREKAFACPASSRFRSRSGVANGERTVIRVCGTRPVPIFPFAGTRRHAK
jgi:hypothetical protein